MAANLRHTFQVLTKRARRMREWFEWAGRLDLDRLQARAYSAIPESDHAGRLAIARGRGRSWPLRNVWLGVSVENQAAADERIPELLATPAAVRWISAEPLIGAVDFKRQCHAAGCDGECGHASPFAMLGDDASGALIDWLVMGAESGPGARAADPAWFRGLAEQCRSAGVSVFFKQGMPGDGVTAGPGSIAKRGGLIGLPYLDGRQHVEMPEVPRG
jgi:protein gp37